MLSVCKISLCLRVLKYRIEFGFMFNYMGIMTEYLFMICPLIYRDFLKKYIVKLFKLDKKFVLMRTIQT